MTAQEAIGYINSVFDEHFGDRCVSNTNKFVIAQDVASEALKKQIPKEPYFEGNGYYNGNLVYDTWRCPNCDSMYEVEFQEHEYCPHCGQAIKWE